MQVSEISTVHSDCFTLQRTLLITEPFRTGVTFWSDCFITRSTMGSTTNAEAPQVNTWNDGNNRSGSFLSTVNPIKTQRLLFIQDTPYFFFHAQPLLTLPHQAPPPKLHYSTLWRRVSRKLYHLKRDSMYWKPFGENKGAFERNLNHESWEVISTRSREIISRQLWFYTFYLAH